MHVIAHGGCTGTLTESALKTDSAKKKRKKKPLPSWGIEPASVLRLGFSVGGSTNEAFPFVAGSCLFYDIILDYLLLIFIICMREALISSFRALKTNLRQSLSLSLSLPPPPPPRYFLCVIRAEKASGEKKRRKKKKKKEFPFLMRNMNNKA